MKGSAEAVGAAREMEAPRRVRVRFCGKGGDSGSGGAGRWRGTLGGGGDCRSGGGGGLGSGGFGRGGGGPSGEALGGVRGSLEGIGVKLEMDSREVCAVEKMAEAKWEGGGGGLVPVEEGLVAVAT